MIDKSSVTFQFRPDFSNVNMGRASIQGIIAECFGQDDSRGNDFCIAATEAMNNAVEHSKAETITIEAIRTPKELKLLIMNDGIKFDPTTALAELNEESMLERDEGGYGLYLIRNLSDNFTYEYRDGRNIWILSKALGVSP